MCVYACSLGSSVVASPPLVVGERESVCVSCMCAPFLINTTLTCLQHQITHTGEIEESHTRPTAATTGSSGAGGGGSSKPHGPGTATLAFQTGGGNGRMLGTLGYGTADFSDGGMVESPRCVFFVCCCVCVCVLVGVGPSRNDVIKNAGRPPLATHPTLPLTKPPPPTPLKNIRIYEDPRVTARKALEEGHESLEEQDHLEQGQGAAAMGAYSTPILSYVGACRGAAMTHNNDYYHITDIQAVAAAAPARSRHSRRESPITWTQTARSPPPPLVRFRPRPRRRGGSRVGKVGGRPCTSRAAAAPTRRGRSRQ